MPTAQPILTAINNGEISPLLYGRVDFNKYGSSSELLQNMFVHKHGPAQRRSGTRFIAEVKYHDKFCRLKDFDFNLSQSYVLEFGDLYVRFYMQGMQLGYPTPYEVVLPYTEAELADLKFAQSGDILYIVHPNHPPAKLMRYGHTNWVYQTIDFLDGPYQSQNKIDKTYYANTTITPAAASGTNITLTASTSIFTTDLVGRPIRLKITGKWGWGKITQYISGTSIKVDIKSAFNGTGAATFWRIGAWGNSSGYPLAITFHQERLFFGGSVMDPQTLWGSMSADFENFAPTTTDDNIDDNNSLTYNISADQINKIVWLKSTNYLYIGTIGPEFQLKASNDEVITPTNFNIERVSNYGSSGVEPEYINSSIVFLQRSMRKLREFSYSFSEDKHMALDITVYGEHLTVPGIIDFTYQQEPSNIIWAVRSDGLLLGFTYDREQNVLAWHRHPLGGYASVVRSVACIPNASEYRDELWLIAARQINGETKQYIEIMDKEFDHVTEKKDGFFVDCGLSYNGTPVKILHGLDHLIGEEVAILADGNVHPRQTVAEDGGVTLNYEASVIHIGLPFTSIYKSVKIDINVGDGTSQGKKQKIHQFILRLYRSLGLKFGTDLDNLQDATYRRQSDPLNESPALYTGDQTVLPSAHWDTYSQVVVYQDNPLPLTILAVIPRLSVNA